jgi:hypothetical protein
LHSKILSLACCATLAAALLAAGPAQAGTGGVGTPGETTPTSPTTPTGPSTVPGAKAKLVDGVAIPPASAPPEIQEVIEAANQINQLPYKWGGGHGKWASSGYDCSGAVSFALHGGGFLQSPLDSSGLEGWGARGKGSWISVYANAGHAYAVIAGLRWDTSGNAKGISGPRWHKNMRSARRGGYTVRHAPGF